MFFESWTGLVRVFVVGSCAYVALIFSLRTAGKRTLSKMNAFDLVNHRCLRVNARYGAALQRRAAGRRRARICAVSFSVLQQVQRSRSSALDDVAHASG